MKEKIALGWGNNIDYEIAWDSGVIEDLIRRYDIREAELNLDPVIADERDLLISILGFLGAGRGGERFVASSDIIEQFSRPFDRKITLGGTGVRAAIAMRKFGYTSALHLVTMNDHVRRLIPQDSPYVCSSEADSSYPHLIVQFGQETRVQAGEIDLCAPVANRLIYHCDRDNIAMKLNEGFADLITEARILLISGFNAMQDADLLASRLDALLRIMASLPDDAVVFYEDAGFYDPSFSELIYRTLAKKISVFSLNEDELQAYLGSRLDLLDARQIEQAVAALHDRIPVPVIVVHSRYWALAHGAGAARFSAALQAGVTMATTRFCFGDDFTVEQYRQIAQRAPGAPAAAVAEALNRLPGGNIHCVPVAQVEPSTATTIGLGDTFVAGFLPALLEPPTPPRSR